MRKDVFIAEGARIVGDVKIGSFSSIWFNAVIRGDDGSIIIGRQSNVQDNAVIHAPAGKGMHIGDNVTIGHGAVVHCPKIGSNVLIGMNATVLEDVEIGDNVIVAAGAVVRSCSISNAVVAGVPAKIIRKIRQGDIKFIKNNAKHYVRLAKKFMEGYYG